MLISHLVVESVCCYVTPLSVVGLVGGEETGAAARGVWELCWCRWAMEREDVTCGGVDARGGPDGLWECRVEGLCVGVREIGRAGTLPCVVGLAWMTAIRCGVRKRASWWSYREIWGAAGGWTQLNSSLFLAKRLSCRRHAPPSILRLTQTSATKKRTNNPKMYQGSYFWIWGKFVSQWIIYENSHIRVFTQSECIAKLYRFASGTGPYQFHLLKVRVLEKTANIRSQLIHMHVENSIVTIT